VTQAVVGRTPAEDRYERMMYRRCGRSGLQLPAISLGAWETFGGYRDASVARECILRAFDLGITYFDFADNYGRPPGNAEQVCGEILRELPRDELVISTKAGFPMWPGPYGDWASRKHLVASCDQSLHRLGVEYVDVFYSHRADPATPIEETVGALATIVAQGKALYAGLSNYNGERFLAAAAAAKDVGLPITVLQPYYNLLGRSAEAELLASAAANGTGVVAFCPLASGLLTDRYLDGEVPADARALLWPGAWVRSHPVQERSRILRGLDEVAGRRGQSLAQMALAWILRRPEITTMVAGASRVEQLEANVGTLDRLDFDDDELAEIDSLTAAPERP
jgi:L-glyceraldehyde 3-phosphate reductase